VQDLTAVAIETPTEQRTDGRILDIAERLVQIRGFNGFSYADIAAELSITKASLHYHFVSKADLGLALIVRYAERFSEALERIDQRLSDEAEKLGAYVALYSDVLSKKRMCLCGILAAEYQTLPEPMREAVLAFFDDNETWLARVLDQGRGRRTLSFEGSPADVARSIIGTLEGAMLVARSYGDNARFDAAAGRLLASLTA
jgi:TetR/AcrR family transcriptional regulator, transcriptional repressor for nem operon